MIRIYGVDDENYVVRTESVDDSASDGVLENIAEYMKARNGATRVFAMFDSKEVRRNWRDYVKNACKRNGIGDIERFMFVDFLESGDWELATAA